jgi:hypothetical protein
MQPSAQQHSASISAQPGKYLVVTLGHESYGIPVLKVREIIRLCPITPVANMPPHVRGVINLRWSICGRGSAFPPGRTMIATASSSPSWRVRGARPGFTA